MLVGKPQTLKEKKLGSNLCTSKKRMRIASSSSGSSSMGTTVCFPEYGHRFRNDATGMYPTCTSKSLGRGDGLPEEAPEEEGRLICRISCSRASGMLEGAEPHLFVSTTVSRPHSAPKLPAARCLKALGFRRLLLLHGPADPQIPAGASRVSTARPELRVDAGLSALVVLEQSLYLG